MRLLPYLAVFVAEISGVFIATDGLAVGAAMIALANVLVLIALRDWPRTPNA